MNEITKGTRIINYLIDIIVISILSGVLNMLSHFVRPLMVYYVVYLSYYFLFEYFRGQTLGKMITNTIIVDINNSKPGLMKILYRTILRLNPFDAFSYLFGQEQGGHDLLSKTRLKIKVRK